MKLKLKLQNGNPKYNRKNLLEYIVNTYIQFLQKLYYLQIYSFHDIARIHS